MGSILELFIVLIAGFSFQLTLAHRLRSIGINKTFGSFLRSPFVHVRPSDIQEIDIGGLPDVFTNTPRAIEHGVSLVELPVGTILHKAMTVPARGLATETDVFNIYAGTNSWVTNLNGAQQYANWGYGDIVSFEVIEKLQLFDISVISNWDIILSRIDDQLKALRNKKIPSDVSSYAQKYIQKEIDRLLFQQKIIHLTIGYGVTWKKQQQLLLEFGDAITNDFTYHPREQLKRRNCSSNDWFSVNNKPTVLRSTTSTFGSRDKDLNRVSFTTALDNIMASTITQFLNVDGYYSGKVPSLFHRYGVFNEEIAVHVPRDKLKILNITCERSFFPCGLTCYNPKQQECLPGGLLQQY